MAKVTTYTVSGLRCGNCAWRQSTDMPSRLEIPQGKKVAEMPCPKCGCLTLGKGL